MVVFSNYKILYAHLLIDIFNLNIDSNQNKYYALCVWFKEQITYIVIINVYEYRVLQNLTF